MGAGEHGEFLQQILARLDRNKVQWPPMNGTIRTGIFTLGSLSLNDASASVHIAGRQVHFNSIDARALNGSLHATGEMDVTGDAPHYSFDAQLLHANAAGIASLWHEAPPLGIVSADTHLELTGYSTENLASSARGTFRWDWTRGALITTPTPVALAHFDHWSTSGTIGNKQLMLAHSQLTRGPQKQAVTGTISFAGKLNLTVSGQEQTTQAAKTTGP
jgi:hypothetical protein